jgi:hypothetical protein
VVEDAGINPAAYVLNLPVSGSTGELQEGIAEVNV